MNLYLDNSNVVELRSLTNSVTGIADESATVTVTIRDKEGNSVAGENWPVSMSHVADGLYRATLSHLIEISFNHQYTADVSAAGSGGEVGNWSCPVIGTVRKCT
jgi:hypothetical protein